MDLFDDVFNDQLLQFSPLCLSPPPEPFTPLMEFLQDPIMEETENVGEETVGLIPNPAISEANLSTSTQSPNLVPFPETLTLVQNPPELEQPQLFCDSHGYLQENLPNRQSDQQSVLDQNMLDYFQEPDVYAMQQQPLLCNSHGYLQGSLPSGQLDQQSLFNQNMMNFFQQPNDSTMRDIGQQMEEENSGYAHPIMTQSFELPNHLQEQFLQEQFLSVPLSQSYSTYPTYQHGPTASHFNMYDQQQPPVVLAHSAEGPLVPRMVTDLAGTYPLQNQVFATPPPPQSSTRIEENVQELVNQPSPRFSYPTLDTYAQLLPCTDTFSSLEISVLGSRQRSYQSHFEHGESSSSAQRRRIVLPTRNVDSTAANPGQERLQNALYDPRYKSLGLEMDPHLRKFSRLPREKDK